MRSIDEQRVEVNIEGQNQAGFGRTPLEYYMERASVLGDESFAEICHDFTRVTQRDRENKWPYTMHTRGKNRVLKMYP